MQHALRESTHHHRLFTIGLAFIAAGLGFWILVDQVSAHGTCSTHHQYRVYDGTHDRDGDGVGCESLPEPPGGTPGSASTTTITTTSGYDRDNWSFNSSSARAALECDSGEHVDHVVALKEAYDSGASRWTNARKRQFANDRDNLWCLEASVNLSKSDHDLAEWSGGSCEQRQYIAGVTVAVKGTYELSIDQAERVAIAVALAAQCLVSVSSGPDEPSSVEAPGQTQVPDFPAGRIMARRLDDGRVEFAYRPEGGNIILPRKRFFPASSQVGRWANSTLIAVDRAAFGRISARLLKTGGIEFSFLTIERQRLLPPKRIFPASSRGRWLRSALIDGAE